MKGSDIAVWGTLGLLLVAVISLGAAGVATYAANSAEEAAQAATQKAFREDAHRWHEFVGGKIEENEDLDAERQRAIAVNATRIEHILEWIDRHEQQEE